MLPKAGISTACHEVMAHNDIHGNAYYFFFIYAFQQVER